MTDVQSRGRAPGAMLSAIVPIVGRHDDPDEVFCAYRDALAASGRPFELIYVLDAPMPAYEMRLHALQAAGQPISIITLAQRFGEAVCLHVGTRRARGDLLVFLPPYLQVEPASLPAAFAALDHADLVAVSRDRRGDQWLNRVRDWGLRSIARLSGSPLRDLGCLVRAFRREVLDHVVMQDEHHRFLPVFAQHAGFVVEQMTLPQAAADRRFRLHGPAVYFGRLLDLCAMAFLLRFIQKPFRFFGSIGFAMATLGLTLAAVLVAQKVMAGVPLGERPAILLAALLIVLGIQIGAVGLIAEIIIFTRAGRNVTYDIERIVERELPAPGEVARDWYGPLATEQRPTA